MQNVLHGAKDHRRNLLFAPNARPWFVVTRRALTVLLAEHCLQLSFPQTISWEFRSRFCTNRTNFLLSGVWSRLPSLVGSGCLSGPDGSVEPREAVNSWLFSAIKCRAVNRLAQGPGRPLGVACGSCVADLWLISTATKFAIDPLARRRPRWTIS